LILIDIFVSEVLFSIDLSKMEVNEEAGAGADAARGAANPLMGFAVLHFLVTFYFTILGLIGAIKYRPPLLRPAYKFAPISAFFTIVFGIMEMRVQRLAQPDKPLLDSYQTLIGYAFSAALDLWYGYAMW
jgi:hypothetical protein